MATIVNQVSSYGVICKKTPEKYESKKHGVIIDGVPFEVDVKYVPVSVLGKGAFGLVCSCFNVETKQSVAVKKIESRDNPVMTLREMQILRQLRHPNVIPLYDVMLSSKSNPSDVYLVQQKMDYDLNNVIKSTPIIPCKKILFKILRGVHFLHSANVIHRDLKPANILVSACLEAVKIADFGHARTCYKDLDSGESHIGTRCYNAPEYLSGFVDYGTPVDIWSVGCVFAEMLGHGKRMFNGANDLEIVRRITDVLGKKADVAFMLQEGSYKREDLEEFLGFHHSESSLRSMFGEAGPLAGDLLERMLEFNPSKRITAKEALRHEYFSGMDVEDEVEIPALRLEVDENRGVSEKRVWELIREEMMFY